MITIKCRFCQRVNLEVSEDTTGTIKTRCKRTSCGRWIIVTLPFKGEAIKPESKAVMLHAVANSS